MIYPLYDPSNGPFPPKVESSRIELCKTELSGGNDVAFADGFIFLISSNEGGSLRICTAEDEPKLLGKICDLGNTRQIEVENIAGRRIAAISARECGLLIVDVSDVRAPFLLCHYNSVEFATGVAFCGNYLAVGCRSFGVELIDLSVPEKPRHVSVIRAGEVQSLCFSDGILFTGSWGERQVNVFDVHDAALPRYLSTVPLEGRGDGLTVKDGILYAAFGQHLRPATGFDPSDENYGHGNGFAVWDVSKPEAPKKLSHVIFPHRFYAHYDFWDVVLCGHYAVIAHTMNGVWIYDVADPRAPVFCDHVAVTTDVPVEKMIGTNEKIQSTRPLRLPFDPKKVMYAPVAGVAAVEGRLFMAMLHQNLHVAKGEYFTEIHCEQSPLGEGERSYYESYGGDRCEGIRTVSTEGQAYAVGVHSDFVYAACGMGGVSVFKKDLSFLCRIPTKGFAMDLRVHGDKVYVADGKAGVAVYRAEGERLSELGRYYADGKVCSQAVPSENGRFLTVQAGGSEILILDVSRPEEPRLATSVFSPFGLIYCRQISYQSSGGRFCGFYWNGHSILWYDLMGEVPVKTSWETEPLGFPEGITGLELPYKMLFVNKGGVAIADIREEKLPETVRLGDIFLAGKPVMLKKGLAAVSNRLNGDVVFIDVSDEKNPRLVKHCNFSGHPEPVCPVEGGAIVPLGHQGIAFIPVEQ